MVLKNARISFVKVKTDFSKSKVLQTFGTSEMEISTTSSKFSD